MKLPSMEDAARMVMAGIQSFVREAEEYVQILIDKIRDMIEGVIG